MSTDIRFPKRLDTTSTELLKNDELSAPPAQQTRAKHPTGCLALNFFTREFGGANRDRTDDLLRARQALSQLSYGPR